MRIEEIPGDKCIYLGYVPHHGEVIQWSCARPYAYDVCPYVGRCGLFCPLNEYTGKDKAYKDALKEYKEKHPDCRLEDAIRYVDRLIHLQAVSDVEGVA